jgi:hypothetical protein
VIIFDTIYLTNKYDMPFTHFIGINHHGESIILGCGLLSGEDMDYLFGYLGNGYKVCVALFQKPLSRTNAKQCGGPLEWFFQKLLIVGVFGILR